MKFDTPPSYLNRGTAPPKVPSLHAMDAVELPPAQPITPVVERGLSMDGSASDKLDKLLDKALSRLDRIMEIELDEDDEAFPEKGRLVMSAINTVMNTAVKADENRLRKQSINQLPAILQAINAGKQELYGRAAKVIEGKAA